MNYLVTEIALRIGKALAALVVGTVIYLLTTTAFGVPGTAELALLSWLSGAALILLLESSPL